MYLQEEMDEMGEMDQRLNSIMYKYILSYCELQLLLR